MSITTDVGLAARTRAADEAPEQRLHTLRATLLGGRGPGASTTEVTEHTRDRPLLGAVPASVERALAARQSEYIRAGTPVVNPRVRQAGERHSWRLIMLGAVLALAVRGAAVRFARRRQTGKR